MEVPHWAYPLVFLASLGFLLILIFSILYVLDPELCTKFLPVAFLGGNVMRDAGTLLLVIGAGLTEGAILNLASSVRLLLPESPTDLRTGGLYSVSRNPIYLGLYLSLLGIFLILPNIVVLLSLIAFIVNNHFRIRREEEYLEKAFGQDYVRYKRKVGRYLLKI
jgi:protein-S-isoprenylcysteine O-methyltransferase Ste14